MYLRKQHSLSVFNVLILDASELGCFQSEASNNQPAFSGCRQNKGRLHSSYYGKKAVKIHSRLEHDGLRYPVTSPVCCSHHNVIRTQGPGNWLFLAVNLNFYCLGTKTMGQIKAISTATPLKEKGDRKPTGMPKELAQGWRQWQNCCSLWEHAFQPASWESRDNVVGILV